MTGIDLSERLIAHARKSEENEPLGIEYQVASYSERTVLPEASFDLVVSTLALMDEADLSGAMRGAYRLLKPGGALAFSVIHPFHITPGLRWERDGTATQQVWWLTVATTEPPLRSGGALKLSCRNARRGKPSTV